MIRALTYHAKVLGSIPGEASFFPLVLFSFSFFFLVCNLLPFLISPPSSSLHARPTTSMLQHYPSPSTACGKQFPGYSTHLLNLR